VADYYARLVSWYTQGGVTDEYGQRHESGHHYKIDWWKVLNEVDAEHSMTPQAYTRVYDAIVEVVRRVDPQIKVVEMALSSEPPDYFEYFLNHKLGIPIEMISYHFYAEPEPDETQDVMQHTYWDQADRFLAVVDYIQGIRARLSPETQTDTDELGSTSADDFEQGKPGQVTQPIPSSLGPFAAVSVRTFMLSSLSELVSTNSSDTQRNSLAFRWWIGIPGSPMPVWGEDRAVA
jgi:hypothetical protein